MIIYRSEYLTKMPNSETEKQYNELEKKHNLPKFREMDSEFEISDLEETNFLLRTIIRKIAERMDFYTTMLEEILQPDTSNLYAMHETRFFSDDEKNRMYDLYRRLMDCNRQSIEVSLGGNENEEADFIKKIFNEWKGIKAELIMFVGKMRASWKTEADIKEDVGYLG